MIKLKSYRDDLRLVQQHFLPYLNLLCDTRVKNTNSDVTKQNAAVIRSLFESAKLKIDKKLLTEANRFTLKFTDAEAIIFYQLLIGFPVPADQKYMITLRQSMIDEIYSQVVSVLL